MVGYMDYQNRGNEYFVPGSGVNTSGATDTRYRVQHRFMLNENDIDDKELSEWFKGLRRTRRFTGTIRNSMFLHYDLQYGGTRELDKQFPGIRSVIEASARAKADVEIATLKTKNEMNEKIIADKDAQIAKLEARVNELESRPVQAPSEAPTLRTAPPPKADYAEPELEVKRTEGDGGKSSANFMQSLLNIEASAKPRAAIAIPEAKKVVESERTPGGVKKLAGGDAVLSVPDFDDMEDLF